eukprot:Hpha_TRINITY_DN11633_c0_g2::TRINITY_DN11633_c0_g2_i1::g.48923::m.48923
MGGGGAQDVGAPPSSKAAGKDEGGSVSKGREEPTWKERVRKVVEGLISVIGAPKEELRADWVRAICMLNGALALLQFAVEVRDRRLFRTPSGERKVASYAVMNLKYVGFFRVCLFTHIVSGATAQLGSSLAIALERSNPPLARRLGRIAATSETLFHAPTAFAMSPIVYGDQGITPLLYGLVSFLLQLSGASALFEVTSKSSDSEEGGTELVELRRMCSTISIFLYVRLYAVMRGVSGMLQKQKYSLAVLAAGTAMMPIGWQRFAFPAYFWFGMLYNRKTATETMRLVHKYGVDGAAKRQRYLA